MNDGLSHQDNSFHNQAQVEPHLSLEEVEIPPTTVQPPSAPPKRRRSSRTRALVIGPLILILLLTGSGVYAMERPHIPGGSASIRITPDSQQLGKTYTTDVTADSTDPKLNPIGAHTVSITTPTKSLTVPATGTQQEPATYARGVLRAINGDAAHPIPFGQYAIKSNSGVDIVFYINLPINNDSIGVDVPAQAMNPGPGGNIAKDDVYGRYFFTNADITVYNLQPFSGGRDGYSVTAVSQTDITNATNQLTSQIQSGLSADQAELKSQLASSEQLLDSTNIQCQPNVKANHNANDQASAVTVTGTMTCSAIAYTSAKLQAYGANLLAQDASTRWGGSYVLVGPTQEKVSGVFAVGKVASFALNVLGLYVLQLNPGLSAHLASLIVGQTQANAQAILLQQTGVSKVSIQVSGGFGTALPSSPKDIHITIL